MLHSSGSSKKVTGAPEQSSGLSAFAAYRAVTQHASRSQVFMPISDCVSPQSGVRCLTLRDRQAELFLRWTGLNRGHTSRALNAVCQSHTEILSNMMYVQALGCCAPSRVQLCKVKVIEDALIEECEDVSISAGESTTVSRSGSSITWISRLLSQQCSTWYNQRCSDHETELVRCCCHVSCNRRGLENTW